MIAAERRQAGLTVVELEGPRLDAAGAGSFRDGMRRIIDGGARRIAIDLGNVEFMDSTGLGALVGCLKYMGEGGTIELRRPGMRILKVLRLTRMDRVFIVREAHGSQAGPGQRRQEGVGGTGAEAGGVCLGIGAGDGGTSR